MTMEMSPRVDEQLSIEQIYPGDAYLLILIIIDQVFLSTPIFKIVIFPLVQFV